MKIAVLVSGSGTILEAILAESIAVAAVLSDRSCRGLVIAEEAGIEAVLVDRRDFGGFGPAFDRVAYSEAVCDALVERDIDLVAMAGFGTVFAEPLYERFAGRVLNTHPALLPAFPGWHGVADALAAKATVSGCTVHLATVEMDAGPILAQGEVPVLADDTVETLHERIKSVERRLYPETIARAVEALRDGQEIESIAIQMKETRS